jgi:hypothetical protein
MNLNSIICPECGLKCKSFQNIKKHYIIVHQKENFKELIGIIKENWSLQYLDLKTDEKKKKRKFNQNDQTLFSDFGMEESEGYSDINGIEDIEMESVLDLNFLENNEKEKPVFEENIFDNVILDFLNENHYFETNNEIDIDNNNLDNDKEIEERIFVDIDKFVEDFEKNYQISDETNENELQINKNDYFLKIKTDASERKVQNDDIDNMNLTQKIIMEEILLFNISKENTNDYLENKRLLNPQNKEIPKNYYEITKLFKKIEILKPKIIENSVVNLKIK